MYEQLKQIVKESKGIVFFGGAGVSTESNIPDFRSDSGIYQKQKYPYPAEQMISADFFYHDPQKFYDFYFHEMIYEKALPNKAHEALTSLEQEQKLRAVVTQNIDGLHQKSGSKMVLELHGSIHRNYCTLCHAFYDLNEMLKFKSSLPICQKCGGLLKPDVVLYGEALDQNIVSQAIKYIANADTLIVGGTSLVVYPAAGLIEHFKGRHLVLINKDITPMDDKADLCIHESIGSVLAEITADKEDS